MLLCFAIGTHAGDNQEAASSELEAPETVEEEASEETTEDIETPSADPDEAADQSNEEEPGGDEGDENEETQSLDPADAAETHSGDNQGTAPSELEAPETVEEEAAEETTEDIETPSADPDEAADQSTEEPGGDEGDENEEAQSLDPADAAETHAGDNQEAAPSGLEAPETVEEEAAEDIETPSADPDEAEDAPGKEPDSQDVIYVTLEYSFPESVTIIENNGRYTWNPEEGRYDYIEEDTPTTEYRMANDGQFQITIINQSNVAVEYGVDYTPNSEAIFICNAEYTDESQSGIIGCAGEECSETACAGSLTVSGINGIPDSEGGTDAIGSFKVMIKKHESLEAS